MTLLGGTPFSAKITRTERERITAHCRPYGIADDVFTWIWSLAALEAGLEPERPTTSESFTEFLAWNLLDLEAGDPEAQRLARPTPPSGLREKIADVYFWATRLKPPREVRVAESVFALLDGDAGQEAVQIVYEVDRGRRTLIVRKAIRLPGPPPGDDES